MPVRIVSDDQMSRDFFDVLLDGSEAFFSTVTGRTYSAAQAPQQAQDIDLTYFLSDNAASGHNLASPAARANAGHYGRFAVDWGRVATEFHHTDIPYDDFEGYVDASEFSSIFYNGLPTTVPSNPDGTRFNQNDNTMRGGVVLAFQGAGGKFGLIRIKDVCDENITLDIKVQP